MKTKPFLLLPVLLATGCTLLAKSPIPTVEEYTKQRWELIGEVAARSKLYHPHLTEEEQKVNTYLKSLLAKELENDTVRSFLKEKTDVENSPLYDFLQKMPKGAILHAHAQALGDISWIVKTITYRPDCYMYMGEPEGKRARGSLAIFEIPPEGPWESVQDQRRQSKNVQAFDQKILESLTISPEDLNRPHVWDKFYLCFLNFLEVIRHIDIYKPFIKNGLIQLIQQDHVQYLELRESPREESILMYREILEEIQKDYPNFNLKIICTVSRSNGPVRFREKGKEAIRLRKKYPEIVAGFDIAGEEDKGYSTFFYLEDILELQKLATEENISLPFYLHAGETHYPFGQDKELPHNNTLYDALLLNSKRVGHGLSLIKNPTLMEKFKKADIAIEVCPNSNQILGYVSDLRNHPAVTYLNAGLPITVSPDDPGIFGYQGVTPDFWAATVAWELDLGTLKQLAKNSIQYSSLNPEQKIALLEIWQQKWDQFITAILEISN